MRPDGVVTAILEIDVGKQVVAAVATGDKLASACGGMSQGDWVEVRGSLHIHHWTVRQREHVRAEVSIEEVKCLSRKDPMRLG